MSRWFRVYDDMLDDPKVQLLQEGAAWTLMKLWCLASKNGGTLPSVPEIAFRLRMSIQDAQARIDDLIDKELIDIRPDGKMEPHNWSARQMPSDFSKERTKKYRAKKLKRHGDGQVTVGDGLCDGTEEKRIEVEVEVEKNNPTQIESNNNSSTPLPPSSKSEDDCSNGFVLGRVGLGWKHEPTVEAKRAVCREHGVPDCEQIVTAFMRWRPEKPSSDVDGHFIAFARTNATRKPPPRHGPIALEPAKPPPRASSSLLATLRK